MPTPTDQPAPLRLDTWKALAQYLGRSPRTLQRWHSAYGLPVRHLGGDSGSVFAFTDELDNWLRDRGRCVNDGQTPITNGLSLPTESVQHKDPVLRDNSFSFQFIKGENGNRSTDLVALAQRMAETASQSNLGAIARLYREAIDLDPRNAQAFAGLSLTLITQGLLGGLHPSIAYEPARIALHRAVEIDPGLIEITCAEAFLKMLLERDSRSAQDYFDRALDRCRSYSPALIGRALLHVAEGSVLDASILLAEETNYNPLSAMGTTLRCWCEYLIGRPEEALALIVQARASGHSGAVLDAVEGLALVQAAKPADYIPRLESLVADSPRHHTVRGVLGYAYGFTGQIQNARNVLNALTEPGLRGKCDYAYASALTLLGLNEKRKAIESLHRSRRKGSLWSLGFHSDRILSPLFNEPGLAPIMCPEDQGSLIGAL